jgi:hypothetical protein
MKTDSVSSVDVSFLLSISSLENCSSSFSSRVGLHLAVK